VNYCPKCSSNGFDRSLHGGAQSSAAWHPVDKAGQIRSLPGRHSPAWRGVERADIGVPGTDRSGSRHDERDADPGTLSHAFPS